MLILVLRLYKNLFLTKKQTDHIRLLILAQVEKGEVIPDNTASKCYLPIICQKLLLGLSTNLRDQIVKVRKNNQQKVFVTRFLNSR